MTTPVASEYRTNSAQHIVRVWYSNHWEEWHFWLCADGWYYDVFYSARSVERILDAKSPSQSK